MTTINHIDINTNISPLNPDLYNNPKFSPLKKFIDYIQDNLLLRKEILKKNILSSLKSQKIQKIKNIFSKFIIFEKFKKFLLIKKILILRESKIIQIQSYYRMSCKRKQISVIIEKNKLCYLIKCKIKYAKNVELKVLFNDKTEKRLNFELCPIREIFILYIEKKLIHESKYYVNFIADGNIIIDPLYRSDYDKDGNFYNIIDFNKLDEEQKEQENEKEYFYGQSYLDMLKSKKKQNFLTENLNFYNEENKLEHSDAISQNQYSNEMSDNLDNIDFSMEDVDLKNQRKNYGTETNLKKRNSLIFNGNKKNSFTIKSGLKYNLSTANLAAPKSILKSPNSSRVSIPKRVSFGNVQFSS